MSKKGAQTFIIVSFLCLLVSSCQKISEETLGQEPQILKVKARSAENTQIKYPLYLYAFDKEGTCSASQTVQQAGDTIGLKLTSGEYRIVAIAGVKGGYVLPQKVHALEEIVLQSTQGATTPMMMGKADVKVDNKPISLNITLSYAVSSISIALNGIPNDVSGVQFTLSPMYGSVTMNGEYGQEAKKIEIPCQMATDSIWRANTIYTFPGSGNETVFSILLTSKDGKQATYAYTYKGKPEANHPFNISGNYSGGVMVGSDFIIDGWDTSIDVEFDFGTSPTQGNTSDNNSNTDETIEVGSIWNNGIVVETNEEGVLLMSLEEWGCYAGDLAEFLEEYSTNGWLLPNETQARTLNATFQNEALDTLNELLEAEAYTPINIDKRYLYDQDGEVYAFGFKSSSKFQEAGTQTKYRVRLVKIISSNN